MSGNLTLEGKTGQIAIKMLKKVSRFLEKHNIPYILEAGTLLGVVRENRLLPWDNDIDITTTRQYEKLLLKHIWKLWFYGYKVKVITTAFNSIGVDEPQDVEKVKNAMLKMMETANGPN